MPHSSSCQPWRTKRAGGHLQSARTSARNSISEDVHLFSSVLKTMKCPQSFEKNRTRMLYLEVAKRDTRLFFNTIFSYAKHLRQRNSTRWIERDSRLAFLTWQVITAKWKRMISVCKTPPRESLSCVRINALLIVLWLPKINHPG